MALPVTITGISTATACVGPYQSSGGNYYFFGVDGTTITTLQAYKATDPTSSWSSIATKTTGFGTGINRIAGYQVGDVIHLVVSISSASGVQYIYQTFDMSSDTFPTQEVINVAGTTNGQTGASQGGCSLVVRSGGEVVAFFNGAQTKTSGTFRARVYYSRRTAVNTWSAATEVDAAGAVDSVAPEAILGTSDAVHLLWRDGVAASGNTDNQRTLSSGSVLQTAGNFGAIFGAAGIQGISYNNAGTLKVVTGTNNSTNTGTESLYFDSGNTPTLNISSINTSATGNWPVRIFNDGTDVWAFYRNNADSDLYAIKSTDDGATWGTATDAFTATVAAAETNLSIDGNIYTRGSSVVIPYIVNDNGTLKYNEYVVRTIVTTPPFLRTLNISQAVNRAATY